MAGKSKNTNITASFGCDLISGGAVVIPRMLLECYHQLGLNDQELVLVLQLLRLMQFEGNYYPSVEELASAMSADTREVRRMMASLMEKEALKIKTEYCDEDEFTQVYSLTPLFEKISELWACRKVQKMEKAKGLLTGQPAKKVALLRDKSAGFGINRLVRSLEQEFGRPLSPIEIDQVRAWIDQDAYDEGIVIEALKRAVLLGKLNFRYIDSILLEWKKNGIHTAVAIRSYEARFKEKQLEQAKSRTNTTTARKNGSRASNSRDNNNRESKSRENNTRENNTRENKRKELLKLLYMN